MRYRILVTRAGGLRKHASRCDSTASSGRAALHHHADDMLQSAVSTFFASTPKDDKGICCASGDYASICGDGATLIAEVLGATGVSV
eukprot:scaffold1634_cov353-Prasinococcus_capsulatus_cf.AAC.3